MGSQLPPELLRNIFRYVPESYSALRDTSSTFRDVINIDVQAARAQVEQMHRTQTYVTILSNHRNSLLVRAAAADHLLDTLNPFYISEIIELGLKLHDVKYIVYNMLMGDCLSWKRVFDLCHEDPHFRQQFITKFANQAYRYVWEAELYKYIVRPESSRLYYLMTMTRDDTYTEAAFETLFPDYRSLMSFMLAFLLKGTFAAWFRTIEFIRNPDRTYPDVHKDYRRWATRSWSSDQEALDILMDTKYFLKDEYLLVFYKKGYDAADYTTFDDVEDWGSILPFVPPQMLIPLFHRGAKIRTIYINQHWTVELYQTCRPYFHISGSTRSTWGLNASLVTEVGYCPAEIVRYMIAKGDAPLELFLDNAEKIARRSLAMYDVVKALQGYQFPYEDYVLYSQNERLSTPLYIVRFLIGDPPANLSIDVNRPNINDFLLAAETGRRCPYPYPEVWENNSNLLQFMFRKMYPSTRNLTRQLPEEVKVELRRQGLVEVA